MTLREQKLVDALVSMADTLVSDFEVVDLFHELVTRCPDLVDGKAAGLMLTDPSGALQVTAASSEAAHLLCSSEFRNQEGPGFQAFRTAAPVHWGASASPSAERWPRFCEVAHAAGFNGATAVPMRLRGDVLGALTVFRDQPEGLTGDDLTVVQAFADLATIAILQHRSSIDDRTVITQLQGALDTRIIIEQAKGVIAQQTGLDMDQAFQLMRTHARNNNLRLQAVAEAVTSGQLEPDRLQFGP